ncbi:MAG: relaxase domain-containing protein [Solirubrobacteraceae bacterium]
MATSWRHTTARAVADQAPDPQLHSHVLLHAAVRRDGEVVTIDSHSWLVHQREVGAAYRTELARELAELGFGVRRGVGRGGRYFELEGVPQALLDRWSSRRHQVRAAIRERLAGQRDALVAARRSACTRPRCARLSRRLSGSGTGRGLRARRGSRPSDLRARGWIWRGSSGRSWSHKTAASPQPTRA